MVVSRPTSFLLQSWLYDFLCRWTIVEPSSCMATPCSTSTRLDSSHVIYVNTVREQLDCRA